MPFTGVEEKEQRGLAPLNSLRALGTGVGRAGGNVEVRWDRVPAQSLEHHLHASVRVLPVSWNGEPLSSKLTRLHARRMENPCASLSRGELPVSTTSSREAGLFTLRFEGSSFGRLVLCACLVPRAWSPETNCLPGYTFSVLICTQLHSHNQDLSSSAVVS